MHDSAEARQDFLKGFSRMVANWKLEQERTEVLVNEYYELFKEVGSDRFHQTVSVLIKEGPYKFFPTINEFRGWIPKAPIQAFCGKCESGWVRRPDYSARRLYRNETATMMVRCECRGGLSGSYIDSK